MVGGDPRRRHCAAVRLTVQVACYKALCRRELIGLQYYCVRGRRATDRIRERTVDFDFTAEQRAFAEQVRRFAREHLAPGALKRAHDPRFPFDVAQLMAKQG